MKNLPTWIFYLHKYFKFFFFRQLMSTHWPSRLLEFLPTSHLWSDYRHRITNGLSTQLFDTNALARTNTQCNVFPRAADTLITYHWQIFYHTQPEALVVCLVPVSIILDLLHFMMTNIASIMTGREHVPRINDAFTTVGPTAAAFVVIGAIRIIDCSDLFSVA